jgi:hypothetical protein
MNALVAAVCLFAAAVESPEVHVRVALDPPSLPFHKQAVFTIEIDAPEGLEVDVGEMVGRFGGLNAVPGESASVIKNGRRYSTITYVIDPIRPGDYAVEPVTATWGDNGKATVPSPGVHVRDLTPEEVAQISTFEPNAGPIVLKPPFWQRWLFWVALLVLLVAAAAGTVQFWRRRGRRVVAPQAPAWETAYARLRELDQRRLPESGQWEPYYVDLTSILRDYIEDRFSLHAPERTTQEFLSEAAGSGCLTENQQRMLALFLRHCDRVKFARYEPTLAEMERSFSAVLDFVDETVPQPVQEAAPVAGEEAA